jgi:hypothetical protein
MASLPGAHAEPAWHRRARRVRSGQRLLAQVSAACVHLAAHHGSDPPALLRPLLTALYPTPPHPRDVPWPSTLFSSSSGTLRVVIPEDDVAVAVETGSHRKTMIMPVDIPEVAVVSLAASTSSTLVSNLTGGVWRPLPINTLSTSSTLDRGTLEGDFRSLPITQWRCLQASFSSSSQVAAFRAYALFIESHVSAQASIFREPNEAVSEALDKCSKLIKVGVDDCPNWTPGDFPHFREGFVNVIGTFLTDLVNSVAASKPKQ